MNERFLFVILPVVFTAIGVMLGWTWNILADVLRMALCGGG